METAKQSVVARGLEKGKEEGLNKGNTGVVGAVRLFCKTLQWWIRVTHCTFVETYKMEFWSRWRRRWKPFASSHNQKNDNNQSKINKQPKVPENQTAQNSDNQGIKEKVNQNYQTGKAADLMG